MQTLLDVWSHSVLPQVDTSVLKATTRLFQYTRCQNDDSTAYSTPEAELVAADTVLRHMLVPSLEIWEHSLQKGPHKLRGVVREDNAACMKAIQSGRNPTMRHLHRDHGVSIRVLHDIAGKGLHSSFCGCCLHPH